MVNLILSVTPAKEGQPTTTLAYILLLFRPKSNQRPVPRKKRKSHARQVPLITGMLNVISNFFTFLTRMLKQFSTACTAF